MSRVVVAGSFNVDHVWHCAALPRAGETLAGEYSTGPGGKGFNQAVAAALAGAATTFVCALGDDDGGRLARGLAASHGIDLRAHASEEPTGTAGIYVGDDGSNSIVIGPGANATLTPDFVAAQGVAIAAADVVLAQLESPVDAIVETLRLARASGAHTVLNPAPANADCSRGLLAVAEVLTPNETEFAALLARHCGGDVDPGTLAGMDRERLHRLCRTLLPRGTVVLTLGAAGCFVSHREDTLRGDTQAHYRCPAAAAKVVDTTGAGDAFNGALAASLARVPAQPFAAHVRFASRYAALSTERPGAAAAMPRAEDVAARFPDA
ncbi:ribokinase [Luteimonas sp. MC1750]|uniref:ribokinase n=1 Tax=Luteimonas sp. MC1750 TaxID=2799326 RepID=UPI0018F0E464|nr:ribokinase [Luteimonas sp. MC1750]MBJ6983519.1 ribokinase [Luteimonas sp. MC1750]QQO06366.1 ribokinase [Luteimonas sp. MC1750]